MKTIIVKKDEYINNSVRVNFFEKDALIKVKTLEFDEKQNKAKLVYKLVKQNKLLYCIRLEWKNNESEIDREIEQIKQHWEIEINS